ncbi:MAG: polysaccharide ABC transporter ATP-binding protein [Patescibacteria group bacterium]|nr:polysaccharide ABC transporter ATP-binding protein [Patescibacteria group bacterium]
MSDPREPMISVKNISKKYKITHQQGGYIAMRDVMANIAKKPFSFLKRKVNKITGRTTREDFWALEDINFDIFKGEAVGIIGANGAGKSTLLKILTGITPPTTGEIKMYGKVASLLEVGTGFHGELTGRENIFLNGAILGMTKEEIAEKFDAIVRFSGVKKFIDTPVKRYSSGMLVRLGFSVAAHMEPDILLVDEVLAVGDAEFQKKCLGKMDEVTKEGGRTILFVSHNMAAIQNLCKRCILIEEGKIKMIGKTKDVIDRYLKSEIQDNPQIKFKPDLNKKAQILGIKMRNEKNEIINQINYQEHFEIELLTDIRVKNKTYYIIIIIYNSVGNIILTTTDRDLEQSFISQIDKVNKENKHLIRFPNKLLKPGQYYISINLTSDNQGAIDKHSSVLSFNIIDTISKRSKDNGYRDTAIVAPEINWISKVEK